MTESFPFVSIVMPIRNESVCILAALESLAAQDYPVDQFEIVIADGISTDGTRELVSGFQAAHPTLQFQLIDNPQKIVPTGINLAIRASKGELILRADGHTTFPEDYVRQCVMTLKSMNCENVGGRMLAVGDTDFGEAASTATSSPFGVGGALFHYGTYGAWVDSVYLGCWPREVFRSVGLFDEELVRDQDDEFNYRLRSHGGRIWYNPEITSTYSPRNSPGSLFKQYFQYGFWKVRVFQKHPRQMSPRQFVPPLFVLALLSAVALAFAVQWGWYALVGLLGVYLFACLAAAFFYGKGQKTVVILLLPLAYTIIHTSYGLGFLIGLLRFANRWNDKLGKVPECPV